MKRDKAIDAIVDVIRSKMSTSTDEAEEVAVEIFDDIIAECVEDERQEWILFSKSAPGRPDGRGLDS
jgi:hypothetical protein